MILRASFIAAAMFIAAAGTALVKPTAKSPIAPPILESALPGDFGDWRLIQLSAAVLPPESELGPGEAVAYRAYQNSAGRAVTLVVAYGPPLGDSVRLHRPESCYVAQGYEVTGRDVEQIDLAGRDASIVRLDTEKALRREAVTYWLRDGDNYVTSAPGHQLLFFKRGVKAKSDGALIRISSPGNGVDEFSLHDDFIDAFTSALSSEAQALLVVPS